VEAGARKKIILNPHPLFRFSSGFCFVRPLPKGEGRESILTLSLWERVKKV